MLLTDCSGLPLQSHISYCCGLWILLFGALSLKLFQVQLSVGFCFTFVIISKTLMVKGLCYCVSLCHRLSHFSLVPSFCLIPHNLKIISGFLVPFKFCIIIFLVISNFLTMCSQFSLQGSLILNLSLLVCFFYVNFLVFWVIPHPNITLYQISVLVGVLLRCLISYFCYLVRFPLICFIALCV